MDIAANGRRAFFHRCLLAVCACLLGASVGAADIEIVGTGDGVAVLEALAEAFQAEQSGVSVTVPPSIGSSGGIKAVGEDKYRIGRVARDIKDKERPYGLTHRPIATVPVVFFVNPGVSLDGLTSQQVLDIYSGKVRDWNEVGGPPGRVRVVRREDGDSSLKQLQRSFPGFGDITLTERSKTATSTPEAFATVESVEGAIGFGPYDVAVAANVKVLTVDGRTPQDEHYPTATTLSLVFKEENAKGEIARFLRFLDSDTARQAIVTAGGSPL